MTWWDDMFREMESLRRDVMKAFDETPMRRRPYSRVSFLPGLRARSYPLLNISEDADNLYIEALAPGVEPESLQVTFANNQLSLSGEKRPLNGDIKPEAYHRSERAAGRFARSVTLPVQVDTDQLKADYRNGLILITLPKSEVAKPKKISISVS